MSVILLSECRASAVAHAIQNTVAVEHLREFLLFFFAEDSATLITPTASLWYCPKLQRVAV